MVVENDPAIQGVEIRNNLFYQAPNSICTVECDGFADAHIDAGASAANVVVARNAYYPGAPTVLGATDATPVTGGVTFANASALDFRLLAGSSAIDSGGLIAEAARDYLGTPRPQGFATDLGAFEFIPAGATCDSIDFNHDGVSPDSLDITDYIAVFGGGTCSTGACGDIDFNNDGVSPDSGDIESFLGVFGGGNC